MLHIAAPSLLVASTLVASALLPTATVAQDAKPASAAAAAGVTAYTIDDVHSCALFRVKHAAASQFWGRFNDVSGTFTVADDPTRMAFSVEIKVDSVDTAEPKLDGHLKSPDFFNAAEFPTMKFTSKSAKKAAGENMFEVSGDLMMHGVTKPVTAMVELTGVSEMMGGRAGIEAIFTVKRSDFGMTYGVDKGAIGDEVRVLVNLEGIKAK
jgi:polyisoprenoid-binding protein YceI